MDEIRQASKRLRAARDRDDAEYRRFAEMLDGEEAKVEGRYEELERRRRELRDSNGNPNAGCNDVVEINAGGKIIAAKRGTLCQISGTRLEALFSGRWENKIQRDDDGRIFLDVNSEAFALLVDYLNEMAISPMDDQPNLPTTEGGDGQFMIDHLLELLILKHDPNEIDSNIVESEGMVQKIHDWLEEEDSDGDFHLLYRSSRDGSSASDFHSRCDNSGCTLTIVRATSGLVAGGYSNTPWTSESGCRGASKAFLFLSSSGDATSASRMKLSNPNDQRAVIHHPDLGPVFGGSVCQFRGNLALKVDGSELSLYQGFRSSYTIEEMEVFQVKAREKEEHGPAIEETKSFTKSINDALNAKLRTIKEAKRKVSMLENLLEDEVKFIELFAQGETKDVIKLNVSGTTMATKRSCLRWFEESVLAQQFDDSKWTEQGKSNHSVKEWTPNEVHLWAQGLEDVPDEVANIFKENQITGNELLALEKDGLEMIGIKRVGTLCLLLKEIKKLEEASQDSATLIEHSPYCFGKILDYLRMKKLHSQDLMNAPDLPSVRESEQCRFEKVVQYFFPGESSQLILGKGIPITIRMAKKALIDPQGSGDDFLKDGRPLRAVTLVAVVRCIDRPNEGEILVDIEDGTGMIQVEVKSNGENSLLQDQFSEGVYKDPSHVRVIGQLEDFGGMRRVLAAGVKLVSGNEITNHFLEVARSYDKHMQSQEDKSAANGRSISQVRISSDRSSPSFAALGCIRTMGAIWSATGVPASVVYDQLTSQGIPRSEVRHAIQILLNDGWIHTTIDESHYSMTLPLP